MKTLASLAFFLSVTFAAADAHGQASVAILSGTTSQGSGGATVGFDGTTLKTDIYFANLDAPSKGAYILCCDADPTRAIPATSSLIDKIAGSNFGSSVVDFDTNQAGFWDNAFSGGDVAGARSKLVVRGTLLLRLRVANECSVAESACRLAPHPLCACTCQLKTGPLLRPTVGSSRRNNAPQRAHETAHFNVDTPYAC